MCAKYYELRCMLKKFTSLMLAHLLDKLIGLTSKLTLCSVSGLKDEKLMKTKQTYMKTDTCKLYSRVFGIFLPMSSKSILAIWIYTVSKSVHFETVCILSNGALPRCCQT